MVVDPDLIVRYRDVNLNVKITTEETRRMGLDQHVCEVLLLLRPFAGDHYPQVLSIPSA